MLCVFVSVGYSQKRADYIQLDLERNLPMKDIYAGREGLLRNGSITQNAGMRLMTASNDVCSEAYLLTVDNGFVCSEMYSNANAISFPNTCVSVSGGGIQRYKTDWYTFYSGNNKTLAVVIDDALNTTSFRPAMAVFGPYTTPHGGCASSMSGPLCENVMYINYLVEEPYDSVKILENISPNSYYMIAIVERRNNADINDGEYMDYCIEIQSTNLDECERTPSGCPTTCGNLCVFDQSTMPPVSNITAGCREQVYSHTLQGSAWAYPEDSVEFCYNFRVDAGCTMSFGGVISASGCGGGNLTSANWRIYRTSTCSVAYSGTSVPPSAAVSTAGDYIFCMKYSAACLQQFGTYYYGYGSCAVVLPVEWTGFTAKLQEDRSVLLNWQTATEHNSHYFEVQRSADGAEFVSLSRVNSLAENGTSEQPLEYAFTDEQPYTGYNYYRLQQVDYDGTKSFSKIVSVKNATADDFALVGIDATVAATPRILFNQPEAQSLQAVIYNTLGQVEKTMVVATSEGLNNYELPVSELPKGLHIIRMTDQHANSIVASFTKY
jgi:hypothetical protein